MSLGRTTWKATFIVRNCKFVKSLFLDLRSIPAFGQAKCEIFPNDKGSFIQMTFDTEVSKPPYIQQENALRLLKSLKEVVAPFIAGTLDVELEELVPLSDEVKKRYDEITFPSNLRFKPEPRIIPEDTINRIEEAFYTIYSGKIVYSGNELQLYQRMSILHTILEQYNRGLSSKELLDKFISLWVTFNLVHDYLWRENHPGEIFPIASKRIKDCVSYNLSEDESKDIFPNHYIFIFADYMPPYLLRARPGTEIEELEEAIKSKNIRKIEVIHEKSVAVDMKELGLDKKAYKERHEAMYGRYGWDYGKYLHIEDWKNVLAEVLTRIYGLRNSVFHDGACPNENDPNNIQFWQVVNEILTKTNSYLIMKMIDGLKG